MSGYWLLISLPALLSFGGYRRRRQVYLGLYLIGLFYLLFIGLRYKVGADRRAYADMYQFIATSPFAEGIRHTEPGFALVNWLVAQIDGSVFTVNFLVAALFVSGLIRFAKTVPLPWIALVSVTPYLVIAIGLSATRQAAAIGLVFHLMASWRQGLLKKALIASTAVTFHYSALMGFIFLQQSIKMANWLRFTLLMLGAAVMYPVLSSTDAFAKYHDTYITHDLMSPGAFMHVLLNVIPGLIYIVTRKKWSQKFGPSDLLPMLSVLSIGSMLALPISSTAVDRLALYLSPVQMIVYGSLPLLFGAKYRILLTAAIVIYHLAIMFWWLNFANTAQGFIPYGNLISLLFS